MLLIYTLFSLLSSICFALLEETFINFSLVDGAVGIHDAAIVHGADDPVGVAIAAESLAGDLEEITGKRPSIFNFEGNASSSLFGDDPPATAIVVGTAASTLVERLAENDLVDLSNIRGKWETFKTTLVEDPFPGVRNALLIAGSDKRGAMFGIYTLAQQCGQSPYHWWADVPATRHSKIYALPKTTFHGEPTVKYRGLFINDEAPALTGWWSKRHGVDHYPLDTEFYRHLFDMMLRLKANYLWPAMWASYVPRPGNIFFTDDPGNQQLADDYGIVVSTSHHEPMQRATNEWNTSVTGPWDWTKNKDNVTRFMEEGIRRAGNNESYFTLGMRGANDSPIEADDPVAVLEDVFATQREILSRYYGNETAANQVWTIYKEVATYYAAGLTPPDDVTLMFTDDNWGNIQRLPTWNETARSGGIGIYFHLEYVGTPKSYKWQNTNNLAKVYKDLYHAYQRRADRIWVVNVADFKPMELPFGFIMDLAWNTSAIDFSTIPDYLRAFATREFGAEHAEEIADILLEHSRLVGRRKPELTTSTTYSQLNHHEIERVLAEWGTLASRVSVVAYLLDQSRQAAFFHLVRYPVHSMNLFHTMVLGEGQNRQYAVERRNIANLVAQQVLDSFDADFDLVEEYDELSSGKWAGMLSQSKLDMLLNSDWRAPSRDVVANLSYVQLRQNTDYEFGNLGIYAEGSSSAANQGRICASIDQSAPTTESFAPVLPPLDPYGPQVRTIDLFHRGDHRTTITWNLSTPYEWLIISPASGSVSSSTPVQRVNVSVPDWTAVPDGFNDTVEIPVNYDTQPYFDVVSVNIRHRTAPADFHGFPEPATGVIAIEAAHFQRSSSSSDSTGADGNDAVAFEVLPHLGTRTDSGTLALRPYSAARASPAAAEAAWVEYDIYLFADTDELAATLYINMALDTDPDAPMMYSLLLDHDQAGLDAGGAAAANFTRLVPAPDTAGDLPDGWSTATADAVWIRNVVFADVGEGVHRVRWRASSPEVGLEKVVLDARGAVGESYLGVGETREV